MRKNNEKKSNRVGDIGCEKKTTYTDERRKMRGYACNIKERRSRPKKYTTDRTELDKQSIEKKTSHSVSFVAKPKTKRKGALVTKAVESKVT